MYDLQVKEEADKIFKKLAKKNAKQLKIIDNKNCTNPRTKVRRILSCGFWD